MFFDYTKRTNIDERYRKRKTEGRLGWTDSYKKKFARIKEVLAKYPIPEKSRILELGCGAGNIAFYLAELGYESYGIDLSPDAIVWAEDKKKQLGISATFCLGNAVELTEYPNDYFELIIDGECLLMLIGSDRKVCLSNIYRILKSNGLFLATANLLNEELQDRYYIKPDDIFDPQTQCLTQDGIPYYYLSREKEFIAELERAGLKVLESKRSPPKHTDHPLIAGRNSVLARK